MNVVARYMAGKTRGSGNAWSLKTLKARSTSATIADRDNCIGYAYAEIELDQPVDGVLLLGVDDCEKIWVNGKNVFEQFTAVLCRWIRITCRFTSRPGPTRSCSRSIKTARAGNSVRESSTPMAGRCRSSKRASEASSLPVSSAHSRNVERVPAQAVASVLSAPASRQLRREGVSWRFAERAGGSALPANANAEPPAPRLGEPPTHTSRGGAGGWPALSVQRRPRVRALSRHSANEQS